MRKFPQFRTCSAYVYYTIKSWISQEKTQPETEREQPKMRDDILLDGSGDLHISETGDISLTDSIRQAVVVRLKWFEGEWRFAPEYGVPYFDNMLVKNPNLVKIRSLIRAEIMSVESVTDVKNITINVDKHNRTAKITLDITTYEETHREEVIIHA